MSSERDCTYLQVVRFLTFGIRDGCVCNSGRRPSAKLLNRGSQIPSQNFVTFESRKTGNERMKSKTSIHQAMSYSPHLPVEYQDGLHGASIKLLFNMSQLLSSIVLAKGTPPGSIFPLWPPSRKGVLFRPSLIILILKRASPIPSAQRCPLHIRYIIIQCCMTSHSNPL